MKYSIVIIILLVIGGAIAVWVTNMEEESSTTSTTDTNAVVETSIPVDPNADVNEEILEIIPEVKYSGTLEDVTDDGTASGTATATVFSDTSYELSATFSDLPEPEGTDFYEGWIVRSEPSSVLSTGRAELADGVYTNTYQSEEDLSDHDFYVLTLEPDDGDDAPADHVLEGSLVSVTE